MKELVYATVNPAKFNQVRDVFAPAGITLKNLTDFSVNVDVQEDGKTAEENAVKKAKTYAALLGRTVLSSDIALYFDDLPDDKQPGLFVRRINGNERASDDEMTAYYSQLITDLGDEVYAKWQYAFALARPNGACEQTSIVTSRIFTSTRSQTVIEGYPLESMQIDPATGKYIADMSEDEQAEFWRRSIGVPLARFVAHNLKDDAE